MWGVMKGAFLVLLAPFSLCAVSTEYYEAPCEVGTWPATGLWMPWVAVAIHSLSGKTSLFLPFVEKNSYQFFSHSCGLLVRMESRLHKWRGMPMLGARSSLGFNGDFTQTDEWCVHLAFHFPCC